MPYRIDLPGAADDALDHLVTLGALDVERSPGGGIAALIPDSVAPQRVADVLGVSDVAVSAARGRDDDSVWVLTPHEIRVGRVRIVPADVQENGGALRLIDAEAFGTGLHPTTVLCLEALDEALQITPLPSVLDIGTGSGVLALAALQLGVPRAVGIDVDAEALLVAAANARLNALADRLELMHGGPDVIDGTWPLVLANVLAAPLIEMAPTLARRVGHHGRLVLSGIAAGVEPDVERAYIRLGMQRVAVRVRAGWVALVLAATW